MPKHTIRKKKTRRGKLASWVKKSRKSQHGGFIFSIGAIIAAISAGISAAAPAVATGALSAAAGYATTKILKKVGGGRKKTICCR